MKNFFFSCLINGAGNKVIFLIPSSFNSPSNVSFNINIYLAHVFSYIKNFFFIEHLIFNYEIY